MTKLSKTPTIDSPHDSVVIGVSFVVSRRTDLSLMVNVTVSALRSRYHLSRGKCTLVKDDKVSKTTTKNHFDDIFNCMTLCCCWCLGRYKCVVDFGDSTLVFCRALNFPNRNVFFLLFFISVTQRFRSKKVIHTSSERNGRTTNRLEGSHPRSTKRSIKKLDCSRACSEKSPKWLWTSENNFVKRLRS